ncbi:MAG: DMT family transporter [Chitinophagaceae bacterium]|nr:DMT family transporter [Chitinophagaceae bacterium]
MINSKLINWVLFLTLCLIWGSSFILMKISRAHLTGVQIASLRIFSAGAILIPFGIVHISKIPHTKILPVIATGFTGNLLPAFMYALAIANGLDSSLSAILNSLTPICVVIIGFIFFKNKISGSKLTGIVVGFTGLCLLFFNRNMDFQNSHFALLVLVAAISYGLNVNFVSHFLKGLNPVHIATISLSFMAIPSFIILWQKHFFSLPFNERVVQQSVLASVVLGIAGSTVGTILFYVLIKKAGGLFASLVTYGVPFIAVIWGIIFGEQVTAWQIVCLGIILTGVYLANKQ